MKKMLLILSALMFVSLVAGCELFNSLKEEVGLFTYTSSSGDVLTFNENADTCKLRMSSNATYYGDFTAGTYSGITGTILDFGSDGKLVTLTISTSNPPSSMNLTGTVGGKTYSATKFTKQ